MKSIHIFDNISEHELSKIILCFNAQIKEFDAHKPILTYSPDSEIIGCLMSGEADLIQYDYYGNRNIIEHLGEQDVFGCILLPGSYVNQMEVISSTHCKILYFDYNHLIKRCSNACSYHSMLVNNMIQILSLKSRQLHSRIEILSRRSIRNKLLTYFNRLQYECNSNSFTLPFTLNSLADYLFIDRSAMLREMKKLRDEGLILSEGRKITLLAAGSFK